MRMTSPPRLPGLVVGRELVAYCALDRLVLIIHPLPRRLQLWEVLDAALDGDHAGICAGAMMATCRGAAAQLSQAGERGREQGARPRSRYPPFDKRRHATCTRRAHSCSNLPKCGVFCMLSLGELPRVPDRSTGGTGGARCTVVTPWYSLRPVPPVRVQALRAYRHAGTRCAPVPCVLWDSG